MGNNKKGVIMTSDRFTQYWFNLGKNVHLTKLPIKGIQFDEDGVFDEDAPFDEADGSRDSYVEGYILDDPPGAPVKVGDFGSPDYTDLMYTGWIVYTVNGDEVSYILDGGDLTVERSFSQTVLSIATDTIYLYLLNADNTITVSDMAFRTLRTVTGPVGGTTMVRAYEEAIYKQAGELIYLHDTDGMSHVELTVAGLTAFAVGRAGITTATSNGHIQQYRLNQSGSYDLLWDMAIDLPHPIKAMCLDPWMDTPVFLLTNGSIYGYTYS